MQVTKNYKLIQQELTDKPDITQIYENWNAIDAEMKRLSDEKFDKAGGEINGYTVVKTGGARVESGGFRTDALSVDNNSTIGGDVTVGGVINANGTVNANKGLTVKGGTTTDTLNVSDAVTANKGITVKGGATVDSLTVQWATNTDTLNVNGEAKVDGKLLVDAIRAKIGSQSMNVGVNKPNAVEELLGMIIQWVNGTTPRISLTHNPDKAANDKQIATTSWVKSQVATTETYGLVRLAKPEDELNPRVTDAAITPATLYDTMDFRRISTSYELGDKVACPFVAGRFLECTKAGTTSEDMLDTHGVQHDQIIDDGSVQWTVRTRIKTINGVKPDDLGNVDIPTYSHPNSGVKAGTYNTVTVNEQGHVTAGSTAPIGLDEADVKRIVLDTFFPVGSTYISIDANFNPNTQFGGSWNKIENRFLLGSGTKSVGQQGGEENVTLNVNQIPSHNHGTGQIRSNGVLGNQRGDVSNYTYGTGAFNVIKGGEGFTGQNRVTGKRWSYEFYNASSGNTGASGGEQAHNNMPPYEVVNIWKRIA